MGSSILRKGRKARNSMPAKINGAGGSETEASGSRASTPKSTRSDRNIKNIFRNGLTRLNTRPQRSRNVETAISTPVNQVVDSPTSLVHDSQDSAMFEADDSAGSMGYESEVYHFGLDGTASPDSNATGNRVSTRRRVPTARALESQASELRMRRKNTPKPAVTPVQAAGEFSTSKKTEEPRPRPVHPRILKLARQFFALAAEAVSEEYTPQPDARAMLEKLRAEFYQKRQEDGKPPFSFGVENVLVLKDDVVSIPSDCELYRPTNTYGDKQLPQPPIRLRSQDQAENDRIFGFPPQAGQKNAPLQAPNSPFMQENVSAIIDKIKLREEALSKGISVDRNTPALEIASMIDKKDPDQAPVKLRFPNAFLQEPEGPVQGRSREGGQELSQGLAGEAPKEPTKVPRKRATKGPKKENTKEPKKEVTKEPTKALLKLPVEPVKKKHAENHIGEPSPPRKRGRAKATAEETGQGGEHVPKRRQTKAPATPEQSSINNDNTQPTSTDEKSKAKRRRADTPVQPTEEEKEPASKRRRTKAAQAAEAEVQNKGASAADEPKVEEARTKRRAKGAAQINEQDAQNDRANAPLEFEMDERHPKKKRRVTPEPQEKKPRQRKKSSKAAPPQRLHLYIGGDKNRQQNESH